VVTKILEMSEVKVELLKGVIERGSREDLSYLIFLLDDALAALDAAHNTWNRPPLRQAASGPLPVQECGQAGLVGGGNRVT
jgi:hypothetical protein